MVNRACPRFGQCAPDRLRANGTGRERGSESHRPARRRCLLLMEAWRITRARKSAEALSGEGARIYGGRWNSPGIRMVYTAGSRSLAILEILAHLTKSAPLDNYVLYR